MSTWREDFLGIKPKDEGYIIKHIIKRDGQLEIYNREKLIRAISGAAKAVGIEDENLVERLVTLTEDKIRTMMNERHPNSAPALEEVQDCVEAVLIEDRQVELAKAYILYRAKHQNIRDTKELMLNINETMDGYLRQSDWRVNENANVNYSLGGLILHNSGSITANYWLKN
ncbi:MAG: ATP cone domain-containing protein, partial [Spirochaetota bacterium]|nr:ATP cone domain-containing protein [Spirochaetota bacterium]